MSKYLSTALLVTATGSAIATVAISIVNGSGFEGSLDSVSFAVMTFLYVRSDRQLDKKTEQAQVEVAALTERNLELVEQNAALHKKLTERSKFKTKKSSPKKSK